MWFLLKKPGEYWIETPEFCALKWEHALRSGKSGNLVFPWERLSGEPWFYLFQMAPSGPMHYFPLAQATDAKSYAC